MYPRAHAGVVAALLSFLILIASPAGALAAAGTQLGEIPRVVKQMVRDPIRPRIYGTTTVNTVIAIDTRTLAIVGEVLIGSNPAGLDISADATRLYVANAGSTAEGIGVVDLTNFTKLPGLPTQNFVYDLAVGLNNRIYVIGKYQNRDRVMQLNGTTGAMEAVCTDTYPYDNVVLKISPDRKWLFEGNTGISPATLNRYDVSGTNIVFKESTPHGSVGSNGQALVVNHAGTRVCYSTGSGQGNYGIALLSADDVRVSNGIMNCDAYPGSGAFSPDDTYFYTTPYTQNVVKIFNTQTYLQVGSFPTAPGGSSWLDVWDIVTNHLGTQVYVANENKVVVYSTGIAAQQQITSEGTVSAHHGEDFSFQVTAKISGSTFTATALPPGLSISQSGLISGVPTVPGDFVVKLTATEPWSGQNAQADLLISVLTPLTVNISGQGQVTNEYAGTTWRKLGSPFTITATPADGYAFASWTGSINSEDSTIAGMVTPNMTLTATFAPATAVTISAQGPGNVSPQLAGTTNQAIGATRTVTATPDAGARFIGWTGSIVSSQPTLTFVVEPLLSLVANFEPIPMTPVTIGVAGPGFVTPSLAGTNNLPVGSTVTVVATPQAGGRFVGWSGSIVSANRSLSFTVEPGMTLTANFDLLASYAGTYQLVPPAPSSRSIAVQLGATGFFTAKITFEGKRYSFIGDFSNPGEFETTIQRGIDLPPIVVRLSLGKSGDVSPITGTIDVDGHPAPITGYRLSEYSKSNPAPQEGQYTWGAGPSEETGMPGGASFGTMRVAKNGSVVLTGVLGDGTPFSAGGQIADGGVLLVERPLYGGKGTIDGQLQFRDVAGESDFDGSLYWVRPPGKRGVFASGFFGELSVIGSRRATLAPGENLIEDPASISFENGGLETSKMFALTVLPQNKFDVVNPSDLQPRLRLNPTTHVFSGSFLMPFESNRTSFRGVILKKSQLGIGQFRGIGDYGIVTIWRP